MCADKNLSWCGDKIPVRKISTVLFSQRNSGQPNSLKAREAGISVSKNKVCPLCQDFPEKKRIFFSWGHFASTFLFKLCVQVLFAVMDKKDFQKKKSSIILWLIKLFHEKLMAIIFSVCGFGIFIAERRNPLICRKPFLTSTASSVPFLLKSFFLCTY